MNRCADQNRSARHNFSTVGIDHTYTEQASSPTVGLLLKHTCQKKTGTQEQNSQDRSMARCGVQLRSMCKVKQIRGARKEFRFSTLWG